MNIKQTLINDFSHTYINKRFINDQSPRISHQSFTADPTLTDLSFEEFIDSFLGINRCNLTSNDFNNEWTFENEIDHLACVLHDNVI